MRVVRLGVECYILGIDNILTVKTGGSVTIPCHYDEDPSPDKKYWKLEMNNFKIYPNTTEENLSVIDHPGQNYFTVTMRNLQDGNTGPYSCVLEGELDGGTWIGIYKLLLRVQPGMWFSNDFNHILMSSSLISHTSVMISTVFRS